MTSPLATIARGDGSGVAAARSAIVRDAAEWRALWAAHAGADTPAPYVDFTMRMVAAVFAGERATPGFEIEIIDIRRSGSALALVVAERRPSPGLAVAQVIVTPFHIATLPRYDGDVRFIEDSSVPPPAASPAPSVPVAPADPASSTGLEPNFAAALAYLAGPVSGALILLVERTNDYVRFHAWQAVIGLGGLLALAAGALVFSFLTLLLSPVVFIIMYRLSEVLAVVWLVAWVVCLVKAFTGSTWKMPIVGAYAQRLAARHS